MSIASTSSGSDRDDLVRLVADELGRTPEPDLAARIWERTGGNPFYAEQVLAAARETSDGVLPPRLRDVVLARLAAVSEAGQEVLRVASAAGTRIDDELVTAVAELPPAVVRAALREVVDRRILIAAGGTADPHFVFRHALLQEVIHGDLFPGERARCHAGFAVALEARAADRALGRSGAGPAPTAEELAYHWDAAGDDRRALAATIEAGRAAERVYAWLDAHRHYLRAIELWERVGDAAQPASIDRTELLVRAAETAILIGQYRLAVELGRAAIAGVDPVAEPARAAALHERQRWYLWEAGDRAAAAVALAEAERLIPTRPPSAARARILAHKAGILLFGGRLAESIPVAEEAIAVAREVGSAGGRGARARDPRLGPGPHRAGRRWHRPAAGGARHRRGDPQRGGHRARRHQPGHPARPGRPDRRCARRGRRRVGAGADDRRRADVRRAAAGDRGEGRHRPRSMG